MKNEEMFKTIEERVMAFDEFCNAKKEMDCTGCKLHDCDKGGGISYKCFAHWLALEAKEEKPEPCPFCGANCKMESVESKSMYFLKCYCGCGYQSGYKSLPIAAILDHNRVARAVAKDGGAR